MHALEFTMKNKLFFIPLLVAFCLPANAEQSCQVNAELLGAHYQVTKRLTPDQTGMEKQIALWRSKQKVLTVDGEQSTTWFKLSNGSVQKTAHFDHFKRSIEYPAKPMTDDRWQQLWQFIPNSQKQKLTLIKRKQEGCWLQETYQWNNENTHIAGELVWNKNLNLVTSLTLTQGEKKHSWQLESIEHNEDVIVQAFGLRATYPNTDFADIGDNESDPFLAKMINLGFIEHGASGFYNAQGEIMPSAHHH